MTDPGLAQLRQRLLDTVADLGTPFAVLNAHRIADALMPVVVAALNDSRQQGRKEAGLAIRTAVVTFPARLSLEARQDIQFALGQAARVAESGGRLRAAQGAVGVPSSSKETP